MRSRATSTVAFSRQSSMTADCSVSAALGLFPDASYEVKSEQLQAGDLLFAYTDGVPEAMDPTKNQFDEQRLLKILQETNQHSAATIKRVLSALSEFTKGAEQHDDITILALRRND